MVVAVGELVHLGDLRRRHRCHDLPNRQPTRGAAETLVRTADLLIPLVSSPSLGILRSFRVLRSARALRAIRATRAGAAALRATRPARYLLERHGLHYILALGALIYLFSAALLVRIEDRSDSTAQDYGRWLVWSITVVTSLDFGFATPERAIGRAIAVVVALTGVTLISIITANIAAFLLRHERSTDEKIDEIIERLQRIESNTAEEHAAGEEQTRLRL